MEPAGGNNRTHWKLDGKKLVNGPGEALDIRGEEKKDGAEVISYSYGNKSNQHWRFEYI